MYEPFERGALPVGVRSETWRDPQRERELPVEIYYPAVDAYAAQDLDPAVQDTFENPWEPGTPRSQAAVRDATPADRAFPLVFNVHGWAGFRREASFISTHLASHGYLVVAPDIPGSTTEDVDEFFSSDAAEETGAVGMHLDGIAALRSDDVPFLVTTALESLPVEDGLIGITGASFGGWTSLAGPRLDPRIRAAVPMCPAGGSTFLDDPRIRVGDIGHGAPTLMLVAGRDTMLPLFGQMELYDRLVPGTRRMVILPNADHNHFVDHMAEGHDWLVQFLVGVAERLPSSEWPKIAVLPRPFDALAPEAATEKLWRGLATAHFDMHLRGSAPAATFFSESLAAELERRTTLRTVEISS